VPDVDVVKVLDSKLVKSLRKGDANLTAEGALTGSPACMPPERAFFVWQEALRRGSRFDRPELDLYSRDVDLLGGFQDASRWGKHPRGRRFAFLDFDLGGLETAVKVDGRINDPTTTDRGWSVEMALPWKSLAFLFDGRTLPPGEGETLRCDFSRFEALLVHGKPVPENPGWSLNPHGVYDSHIPESFSVVRFTKAPAGR